MGIFYSLTIIFFWACNLIFSLIFIEPGFSNPLLYIHLAIQTYLYTGLFITAHDAMHGTVYKNKFINDLIGSVSIFLFAFMDFSKLKNNHFKHHKHPGEAEDPDYYIKSGNFFIWWFMFMYKYTTVIQLILLMICFNLLNLIFREDKLILFWVVPPILASLQLFYFGTYLPHKLPHEEFMQPHNSRTLKKNHIKAMLQCYFFGYHWEHHEHPETPWWELYKTK